MVKLNPCGRCGDVAKLVTLYTHDHQTSRVECMGCGRSTDWADDEELAIFHWNEFTSMSEEEYKAFMDEGITPNEYQAHCLRTNSDYAGYIDVEMAQLQNGLMGLNGEAGECIDILKKVLFQGHELDEQHLAEELGDVLWYVAISADALGYSLERIMIMNRDKLMKRYPDGFEVSRSVNRNETALSEM